MRARIPLAWLQLKQERGRLTAALAGVAFAVILMLMQLGFEDALFESGTTLHRRLQADLVMISPQYQWLLNSGHLTERRLYQARAVASVESASGIHLEQASFKNPETRTERSILLIGFRPKAGVLPFSGIVENLQAIREPNVFLFDGRSRAEYGPIPRLLERKGRVLAEVSGRAVEIAGLYQLGTSFGVDGSLISSDVNLLRLTPGRPLGVVNLGLIRLRRGMDPAVAREELVAALPRDVRILTRQEFIDLEGRFWRSNTPIGFILTLGVILGLVVGCVIVYQILYTNVNDHLADFATLKAMGYTDGYLFLLVLDESLILSVLGFVPGLLISWVLYRVSAGATELPLRMTLGRVVIIYVLTALMCAAAGGLAMRRLRSVDPAEIFR